MADVTFERAYSMRSWVAVLQRGLMLGTFLFFSYDAFLQPARPKVQLFSPVSSARSEFPGQPQFQNRVNPLLSRDPYVGNNYQRLIESGTSIPGSFTNREKQVDELTKVLGEEKKETSRYVTSLWSKKYQLNFQQLLETSTDSFSITKAVYLTESAYYDGEGPPPFQRFEAAIRQRAEIVRQILKREGLNEKDNTAVNYAIQKLFTQSNLYTDPRTGKNHLIERIRYDFNDYMGEKDWGNMFVAKLLKTGSGQCHNLPLFFLCLTEQLHSKAYLSISPNHSFIQYFDKKGNRYNFETTNGTLVSLPWLMQSTFVTAQAVKNGTYLDTLSTKKLHAYCLSDLLLGYLAKIGYDEVSKQMTDTILTLDSTNIAALMTRANDDSFIFYDKLKASGFPPQSDLQQYPILDAAFQKMQLSQQKVDQTGFQEMPANVYQGWLKSMELAKQKELNRKEQERLKREIEQLKKVKVTFKNSPQR